MNLLKNDCLCSQKTPCPIFHSYFQVLKLPCTFQEVARYIREALPEEMKSKVPSKVSEKLGPAVMGPAPPLPVLYDVSPAEKLSPGSLDGPGSSPPIFGTVG